MSALILQFCCVATPRGRSGPSSINRASRQDAFEISPCPYRKSNPHVLMVKSTKHRPHFDAPGALDVPPNGRILAQR